VEVRTHTFISVGRVGISYSVFVIFGDGLISFESLTVSLYHSWWGEEDEHIEGKVYTCTAVPIQINRIRKLFLSPTVITTGVTPNTAVGIKTNSLTIFVPAAFYLISWRCRSKQKSRGEFQTSHYAKTSLFTTAMTELTLSLVTYRFLQTSGRKCLLWQLTLSLVTYGFLQTSGRKCLLCFLLLGIS